MGESPKFFNRGEDFLPKAPNIIFRLMSHWREFEKLSPHMETNPGLKGSVMVNYCETAFIPIRNSAGALCFGETVIKCNVYSYLGVLSHHSQSLILNFEF